MERKKRAAAMAAVYALIRSSEERQALSEQTDAAGSGVPSWPALYNAFPNIWGVTGRQSLMQANTMMQLRMFK